MTKMNMSAKSNREFNNQAGYLAIHSGVDISVAKNILRWRKQKVNQNPVKAKRVWLDPKTNLPLTVEQWTGPALKLKRKISFGTWNPLPSAGNNLHPDESWADAECNGMTNLNPMNCGLRSMQEGALLSAMYSEESKLGIWD